MAWFDGALVDGHILHGTMVNQYDRTVLVILRSNTIKSGTLNYASAGPV